MDVQDPFAQQDTDTLGEKTWALEPDAPQDAKKRADEAPCVDHRVLVGLRDGQGLVENEQLLSSNGKLNMFGYESEEAADAATRDFSARADVAFVARDCALIAADEQSAADPAHETLPLEDSEGNPVLDLGLLDAKALGLASQVAQGDANGAPLVALIDSGVPARACVVGRSSVIGDELGDDNGHGTRMLDEMEALVPGGLRVMSIKALNAQGHGTVASVYAAILQAIEARAAVICLSLSSFSDEGNAALADAVRQATDAGVLVVASAGNEAADASYYLPGSLDEVLCVGALECEGKASGASNFGAVVDAWALADSTSQAAARVSAWLAYHSSFAQAREDLSSVEAHLAGIYGPEGVSYHLDGVDDEEELLPLVPDCCDLCTAASVSVGPVVQGRAYYHEPQTEGAWTDWVANAAKSEGERAVWNSCGGDGCLSAVQFTLVSSGSYSGGIEYALDCGETSADGAISGYASSSGAEAGKLSLRFTGELAKHYDLCYQVHDREASGGMDSLSRNGEWAQHTGSGIDRIAWNPVRKSWKVLFVDDSVVLKEQLVEDGASAMAPELPTRQGYRSSWSRDATNICADTTISVVYTPDSAEPVSRQQVLARYQAADGSYGDYETVLDADFAQGDTCCWSRPQDETYQEACVSYVVCAEQTSYVDVERNGVRVVFEGNGATDGAMGDLAFRVGAPMTLSTCGFTRAGFAFSGWNTLPDGSGTSYEDGATIGDSLQGESSLTLYAQWQVQQLSVTVPVALHYVVDEDGQIAGPLDESVSMRNTGGADVGVVRMELQLDEPWNLVGTGQVEQACDVSLGLRLGDGARLDFSQLEQLGEPYAEIPSQQSVFINDLSGTVGTPPREEMPLGSLHWSFSAV
ncbi:MAG: S8 family serine peptidase [Coriobacteriales bacterium]|nr:S8 family serine peptidase [Coriobacteriales bacterium]